jgi:excisionase family DNA binding protein
MESTMSSTYTPDEVAERTGRHKETIRRKLRSGQLDGFKFGQEWRVTSDALRSWLGDDAYEAFFASEPAGTEDADLSPVEARDTLFRALRRLRDYAEGWQGDADEMFAALDILPEQIGNDRERYRREQELASETRTAASRLRQCVKELRQTADKIEQTVAEVE